jgi:NADPH:quinone reductase-like Zn-dependent oxidoreductase
MRALTYAAYGPIENLRETDVEAPAARRGQLIVDVTRAALNPKDALFRKGKFALVSGRHFPKRCGLDYAGVVRVSHSPHFQVGDRVFGALQEWTLRRGTLAEQVCVSDEEAAHIPSGVSDDDAASIALCGLTALQALRDLAHVKPGTRVWVHGASGGVGTLAVQIAHALGAMVVTTSSDANLGLCTSLGAHEALDYTHDVTGQLAGRIDVVFDVFGNLRVDRVRGVFAARGVYISTVPSAQRAVLEVFTRRARIQQRLVVVKPRRADLTLLASWLAQGTLHAVIDRRFAWAEVHDAFRVLESKRARGKLVIEVR